jgi:hypothetical protein
MPTAQGFPQIAAESVTELDAAPSESPFWLLLHSVHV